jgi:hypothetical protein
MSPVVSAVCIGGREVSRRRVKMECKWSLLINVHGTGDVERRAPPEQGEVTTSAEVVTPVRVGHPETGPFMQFQIKNPTLRSSQQTMFFSITRGQRLQTIAESFNHTTWLNS